MSGGQRCLGMNVRGDILRGGTTMPTTPGYFQEIMDKLSKVLQGVAVYMDDILVSGTTAAEHLQNLHALLRRLEERVSVAIWRSVPSLNLPLSTWDTPSHRKE